MRFQTGLDRFLQNAELREPLSGERVALVAHPASVTSRLEHAIDALIRISDFKVTAAFGPQHGMKGDKQYNMMETEDTLDVEYNIPIYSLYGKVRRPTPAMLENCDAVLFDLQDLGCRIYTFETTLLYMMEACATLGKSLWVLDRPNPAGRPIEGLILRPGFESFVGAGPLPMRHGLTVGELAYWYRSHFHLDVDLHVIPMDGYDPNSAPGYGWPLGEQSWVNPSPNAPTLSMARLYSGSVFLEGTTLSEGRGTTRPLEIVGAPDLPIREIWTRMRLLAPEWLLGARSRICHFAPTFYKYQNELCAGLQIHVDDANYVHEAFKPWRTFALFFKALRLERPDYPLWRHFAYEYVFDRLAIDVINGSALLRDWVDDKGSQIGDLEKLLSHDEKFWAQERRTHLIYAE